MPKRAIKRALRQSARRTRHHEDCVRKTPFASYAEALAAALHVSANGELQVYRCVFDDELGAHWHFGNRIDTLPWKRRGGINKGRARERNWLRRVQQTWLGAVQAQPDETIESEGVE